MLPPSPPLCICILAYCVANFALARRFLYCERDIVSQAILSLALGALSILAYGSVLASLGVFLEDLWCAVLAGHSAIILIATLIVSKRPNESSQHVELAPILLCGLVCLLYIPPSQITIGGQDPAVYVAASASLAYNGQASAHSSAHELLSPDEREQLLGLSGTGHEYNWLYNGAYFKNDDSHTYFFDFARGPSYLLAFCMLAFGLDFAFVANFVFCLLAIYCFYLCAREFLETRVALLTAAILALSPPVIWFGKATYSEVPSLFCIFF